jgi:hypothetical protein
MKMPTFVIATGTAIALATWALAQESSPRRGTIEERVAALEAGLATLDTRLALQTARPTAEAGQTDFAIVGRLNALESAVTRLTADLQRVGRVADNAARAADQAQRSAERAEQTARSR